MSSDLENRLFKLFNVLDNSNFFTDEEMESPNVDGSFRGLELDEDVLRKIYYENALRWFPEIFR